ncbi:phenolic glucoside malonyltransferase 1-like [Canna indica]|uniref:Phenolic glucoside malonyltransferase 1-like n=1 Tax=Canna indica TaxID=4628 RepID=A0AAQ3KDN8_9LILI|nr:phenolic glucoside malonyltransferase 1-like [Canna indica]
MSLPPAELRVLGTIQVSPPPGTVAESILPLTFLDLIWLNAGAVERVFFYSLPHSTSYFIDSLLPNLKSSLSVSLQQFYPLAGKIRRSPDRDDRYELHYVDGDAVPFTVAENDGDDFDDFSRSHARDFKRVSPLIPQLPKQEDGGKRLLALQVTVFPNQGVAIGVTVQHTACDGSSSMRFMSWWAATCARAGGVAAPVPPTAPVFDRTLVADPRDLYSVFYKMGKDSAEIMEAMTNKAVPPDAVIGTFALGADDIRRLKEMVSSRTKFHCSTIVVLFAFVWVCLVKARAIESDERSLLIFVADCRGRLQPPLPESYFGNCLTVCFAELTAGELKGEDGTVVAARSIGKAIDVLKEGPFEDAAHWPEKFKNMVSQQPLSVAGSPKLKVYDMDFGWGRPKKVEIPSIRYTGAMSVAESREEEGGVEIGFVLPKHEMEEFEKHFTGGLIKLLH